MFDVRRRSACRIARDGNICRGDYRRIAGYMDNEMEERPRFSVKVTCAQSDGLMRVVKASVQTIYGKVRLKRQ